MSFRIIGGLLKNRVLRSPSSVNTRPSLAILRKAVFDILQDRVIDAEFLDLFAGTGAMGIEALSRGAKHATFIDQDHLAVRCIQENLKQFHLEDKATLIKTDAIRFLTKTATRFDIIYIDPPYAQIALLQQLAGVDLSHILNKQGTLFIEEGAPASGLPALDCLRHVSTRQFSQSILHEFQRI